MIKRDYYEVLSVGRDAEPSDIKRAYRELAKKYHPDFNPGDPKAEEQFKEASEAYEVLRDPERRRTYDQFGHEGLRGRGFEGFSGVDDIFSSFSDIFDSFFGFGMGSRARTGPSRGADLETGLRLSFREAVFGCKRELEVQREVPCEACGGSGAEPGHEPETCDTCGGRGQVERIQGFFSLRTSCPHCRGTGKFVRLPCRTCRGAGRTATRKKLEVEVPAGVDSGMRVRIAGEGEGGYRGGPPGDLYVSLAVEEDALFRRQEEHLFSPLEVGIAQAALGATVRVETLDGPEDVEVPKGTQNGDVITLKGKGVPRLRKGGRGNHFLEVHVVVPHRLSQRQEELLREFASESAERVTAHKEGFFGKLKSGKKEKDR